MFDSNKDSQSNITASFGADFFQQGATSIPNLLLKYYKKIGLNDQELILIIHLLRFKCEDNDPFPTTERLNEYMSTEDTVLRSIIAGLIEKNILTVVHYYVEETGEVFNSYSYDNLFEKISEVWAQDKMSQLQRTRKAILKNQSKAIREVTGVGREKNFTKVYKAFEREFGRLLSPIEIQEIQKWLEEDGHDTEIVMEALRRAVLLGKHNFKYIDSILLEWKKNSIHTLNEINSYDANFKQRQGHRPAKNSEKPKSNPGSSKKDKIKLLYYNL